MRSRFDQQLDQLNHEMTVMGMLCENAISKSTSALLTHDLKTASSLADMLDEINQKDRDIEGLCMKLLLQQQPVARDLRTISSALKMVSNMDRIGVQSVDIAEIVSMDNIKSVDFTIPIREMATDTVKMVSSSIDAFVKKDIDSARNVIKYDDIVDNYFNEVKKQLIAQFKEQDANAEMLLDLLMIAKYLERIGDQAVNVASWVIFSITGNREGVQGK